MASQISNKVSSSNYSLDENFIKTIIGLTIKFPGYTIEKILTEVKIPRAIEMAKFNPEKTK